jgi:hypothetical protein
VHVPTLMIWGEPDSRGADQGDWLVGTIAANASAAMTPQAM